MYMYPRNRERTEQQTGREQVKDKRKSPPEAVEKRSNPRLVFNDPIRFFDELLMEQMEQQ